MVKKGSKTILCIVSVLVFVGCCAAMIANFNLWFLPLAALPFLLYGAWNYKGTWESDKVDQDAIKSQEEEPYSETWPYSALDKTPSKDFLKEEERLNMEGNPTPPRLKEEEQQTQNQNLAKDFATEELDRYIGPTSAPKPHA